MTLHFNACIFSSMHVFDSLHFNACIFSSMHVYLIQCIYCIFNLMHEQCMYQRWSRGHKARGQGQGHKKKSEAKDSLCEDRHSRGQGQECSRPRPKDTGASVLQKKKSSKKFFLAISNSLAYPEFLIVGGLNHESHEMTSSKFFQIGSFCGTTIS